MQGLPKRGLLPYEHEQFSHPVSKHKDGDGQNTQLNATEYHQPASRWLHPSFYIVLWVQPYVWHFKRPDIDGIINYCFKFLEIVTHCYLVTIYHRWTVCCTTSLFSSYSGIFWLQQAAVFSEKHLKGTYYSLPFCHTQGWSY